MLEVFPCVNCPRIIAKYNNFIIKTKRLLIKIPPLLIKKSQHHILTNVTNKLERDFQISKHHLREKIREWAIRSFRVTNLHQ